jgi:hypothetical protein
MSRSVRASISDSVEEVGMYLSGVSSCLRSRELLDPLIVLELDVSRESDLGTIGSYMLSTADELA